MVLSALALALPVETIAAPTMNGISGSAARAIDTAAASGLKQGGSPAVAVAIGRKGRLVFSKAYGFANLETKAAATSATIFRIGSLTKQFTAAALLKLAGMGRVSLDDSLAKYFPDFPRAGDVTLRQLANQTAGLHDDESGDSGPLVANPTNIEIATSIGRQKQVFDFDPGTAWKYSNSNYLVLGGVIEKASGQPLKAFLQREIFAPAGMRSTALDDESDVVVGRASGYTPIEGPAGSYANAAYLPVAQAGGAGAIRSTVGDLCAWHHALLKGEVIASSAVQEMVEPGRLKSGELASTRRFSEQDRTAFADTEYGFGLVLGSAKGQRVIAHSGGINGFASYLATYLEPELTVAILTNADGNPNSPLRGIRKAVVDELL